MRDYDRSDMMDKIVFWFCMAGWGVLSYLLITGGV